MFKNQDVLKGKLSQISAKTLSLGGKQFVLARNERKIKFSEAFQHTALGGPNSFRILKILPGSDSDVISVELSEVSLDGEPRFDALSYTWNLDPTINVSLDEVLKKVEDVKGEQRPILCNGKTLHITMNLYHALAEFRRSKLETPIWADQVCINQQDDQEKIAQLAIMRQIYTSASTVVIWLGTLNTFRNWALDFMETLPDHYQPASAADDASPQPVASGSSMLSKAQGALDTISSFSKSLGDNSRWVATLTVLGRKWFERIWTLQELLLAQEIKIIMGSREIPPSALIKAAGQAYHFFATDPLSLQTGFNSATNHLRDILPHRAKLFEERNEYQSGKRYTAEEYLLVSRMRQATVSKDRVFAGAALLEQGVPESVNYLSTTRDIFHAFALERLWPQKGISSLALVGGALSATEGLPSWVPDLSVRLRPGPLRNCGSPKFQSPIEGGANSYRIDGNALHIQAGKWGSVKQTGESIWSWAYYEDKPYNIDELDRTTKMKSSTTADQERFGLMFSLLNDLGTVYTPTGERTFDAFWKTLMGGAAATSDESAETWRDRFCQFFAFTLITIRSNLNYARSEKNPETWKVPLIQELPHLEERVSAFLETHDQDVGHSDGVHEPLKKVITAITNRIWGADMESEARGWRSTFGEMAAAGRREEFYTSVSIFGDSFRVAYDGRRIFTTENGFLGISSEGVRAGDVILLLAGADVPYVFRPEGGAEASYTLVGEAYIHGLSGTNVAEAGLAVDAIKIL